VCARLNRVCGRCGHARCFEFSVSRLDVVIHHIETRSRPRLEDQGLRHCRRPAAPAADRTSIATPPCECPMALGSPCSGGDHLTESFDRLTASRGAAPTLPRDSASNWLRSRGVPNCVDVLVLDAENRQSLAAMRSYGRQGLTVGAVLCASQPRAPSFDSRWCGARLRVPDYSDGGDAYIDAIIESTVRRRAQMVLPGNDGSIDAIRRRRAEIECLTGLALASEQALSIAVDKQRTLQLARDLGMDVPRSVFVSSLGDLPSAVREIGYPIVIKPVHSWARNNGNGRRATCRVAQDRKEAEFLTEQVLSAGLCAMLQEWLPGIREAVSLFYARRRFWARFAQVSFREFPLLGGATVMCEGVPLDAAPVGDAQRLVEAMGLEGCSMVEFRQNRLGVPTLMEVNPRMAGSVALAIRSGVDFPRLTYEWATERHLQPASEYAVGKRLRWLAGDIWNLKFALEEPFQTDAPGRSRALGTFVTDFFRRPAAIDPFSLEDPLPGVREFRSTVVSHAWGRLRQFRFKPGTSAKSHLRGSMP
jgi:predicted ATP-grasp superfamily ATP-dependent carboligase